MNKLGIIGFGNQAKAWANNGRDSGMDISIIARENSPSLKIANEQNFKTYHFNDEQLSEFEFIALLTPDHTHIEILDRVSSRLNQSVTIILAHGYSITYQKLNEKFPQFNFALLAPKAIGSELRNNYVKKYSLGAVYCCANSQTENEVIDLAKKIGITHGPYKVTFEQETIADLFSEQSILCSLLPYGAMASFNQLRSMGIPKELAYFECWYEVKLIADTMIKLGPEKFFEMISPNALIGSEVAREKIFNQDFFNKIDELAEEIKEKKFAKTVDETNFDQLKNKVMNFWKDQEINSVHKEMGNDLYQ